MSAADKKKKGLGKGLEALLSDMDTYKGPDRQNFSSSETTPKQAVSFVFLSLDDIKPNAVNPRKDFKQESLDELAFSIAQHGVIQPITVRKIAKSNPIQYELISGERRFRASKIAGKMTIPAYIRSEEEGEISMLELALIENIQREDLNAIEIAISYQRLLEECALNQEQLSDRVAKKRSTVTNYLRLLRLCPEIQAAVRDQRISMGHARALLSLDEEPDKQLAVFALLLEQELSVRQTEELVRQQKSNYFTETPTEITEKKSKSADTESAIIDLDVQEIQQKLSTLFDMKVDISCNKKGSGKIAVHFNSLAEINQLMTNLGF